MNPARTTKLTTVATYALAAVLVLVPFHALITVSLAALTGNYELWRLWKEIVLLLLTPVVGIMLWKDVSLRQRLRPYYQKDWLFWAIVCYVLLHIALGLVALLKGQVNTYALLYAWIVDLRPLLIFVLAFVIASQSAWLRDYWRQLLLWPAVLVIGFGLLQAFVLPIDFLRHFGYSTSTISPFETVDEKLDYIRIQSTLRGANPLGAYLVLVLGGLLVLLLRKRSIGRPQIGGVVLLVTGLVVLVASYSRSAYVGLALTALAAVLLIARGAKARRRLAISMTILLVLAAGLFAVFRENDRFENTFFHTNEDSPSSTSSNEQRLLALQGGTRDVLHEPFGRGPGTAGPASAHNARPARIAENYYLQIGQETGWLGLGLFIAILVMVAKRLWHLRSDPLARVLLVSLVGISFINFVQHAWTDDTLALLWWGLAGIALAHVSIRTIPKAG